MEIMGCQGPQSCSSLQQNQSSIPGLLSLAQALASSSTFLITKIQCLQRTGHLEGARAQSLAGFEWDCCWGLLP